MTSSHSHSAERDTEAEVDILFFEVGTEVFGADASQIVRIDLPDQSALQIPELGSVITGKRALVFMIGEGEAEVEAQLRVDAVLGIKPVPLESLRRLPPTASAKQYAIGVCLQGQAPVLLLDLVQLAQINHASNV